MKSIAILIVLTFAAQVSAADSTCKATIRLPAGWVNVGGGIIHTADGTTTLKVECSALSRALSDTEFSEYIGEEEPEEAPPLRQFGPFKGRIWIHETGDREWWLMESVHVVHLTAKSKGTTSWCDIERQINDSIPGITIGQP